MLVPSWWWLISVVDGRIIMLVTFFVMLMIFWMYLIGHQYLESVINISNLSPTHLVCNIRHQHRCYRRNVFATTLRCWWRFDHLSQHVKSPISTIFLNLRQSTKFKRCRQHRNSVSNIHETLWEAYSFCHEKSYCKSNLAIKGDFAEETTE